MKTKRTYQKPSMQVFELRQQPQLLQASGLPNPTDYPRQPDPFSF